jgi:hypothetical protein
MKKGLEMNVWDEIQEMVAIDQEMRPKKEEWMLGPDSPTRKPRIPGNET